MTRNVVRIVLIVAGLGVGGWLFLVSFGLAWASADSGLNAYDSLSSGIGTLMLLLFPGWLLCLAGGRWALRVAAVLGVVLLGYGVGLVASYHSVYDHDTNSGAISLGMLLPGVLVLGGVWLMYQATHKTDAPSHGDA